MSHGHCSCANYELLKAILEKDVWPHNSNHCITVALEEWDILDSG